MVFTILDFAKKYRSVINIVIVIVVLLYMLFNRDKNVNKPRSYSIALPGSTVTVDQKSEVEKNGRPWSIGIGAFGGRFDNRDIYGVIGGVKYEF